MKDPITRLQEKIERLEREMGLVTLQMEKVLRLYNSLMEYFKYIAKENK